MFSDEGAKEGLSVAYSEGESVIVNIINCEYLDEKDDRLDEERNCCAELAILPTFDTEMITTSVKDRVDNIDEVFETQEDVTFNQSGDIFSMEIATCEACGYTLDADETLAEHVVAGHLTSERLCDICGAESEDFFKHFKLGYFRVKTLKSS